jgi:hypothetical protein
VVVDHVFVCCSPGGGEADALARLGLLEGSLNTHPGQGTACRRFFFSNAYLELLWVTDPREAQTEAVLPTRLYERWSKRGQDASPFGVVLRPSAGAAEMRPPFASWSYRAPYLPPQISIDIARDTLLSDPEFFYLAFQGVRARGGQEPLEHGLPVRVLTGVTISRPDGPPSPAAEALYAAGVIALRRADQHLMELRFHDGNRGSADLRPILPLILRW